MHRPKVKATVSVVEQMLEEASWLLSHAESLADYGRKQEAAAELARAANCEEQVACLLEVAGREGEAAAHRVSAASCLEQLGQFTRAVTLLRAGLSSHLPDEYRAGVEKHLARCLSQVSRELGRESQRRPGRQSSAVP